MDILQSLSTGVKSIKSFFTPKAAYIPFTDWYRGQQQFTSNKHNFNQLNADVDDVYINRYTYSRAISSIRLCIEIISNSVADIPIYIYSNKDEEPIKNDPKDSELWSLLERPNQIQASWKDFIKFTVAEYYRNSSIFWLYDKIGKQIIVLEARAISILNNRNLGFYFVEGYRVNYLGNNINFSYNPVSKLYENTDASLSLYAYQDWAIDGMNGQPCKFLGVASEIKTVLSARSAINSTYDKGVNAGILLLPQQMFSSVEEKAKYQDSLTEQLTGASNSGRVLVMGYSKDANSALNAEPKYVQLGGNPNDMQYNATISESEMRIISSFGVPLPLVRDTMSHYNNMEQGDIHFYSRTVSPLMSLITSHLTNFLMPLYYPNKGLYFDFTESDIKAFKEKETLATTELLKANIITPNEARGLIGFEKLNDPANDALLSTAKSSSYDEEEIMEKYDKYVKNSL